MNQKHRLIIVFTLVILLSSFLPSTYANNVLHSEILTSHSIERDYWPTENWRNSTPEEQGMDSSLLQNMLEYIDEENVNIHSVLVVKNGYIVLEEYPAFRYDENSTHLLYSVTKSFTSALIGIAIDQGYIDNTSQTLLSFFPDYNITNVDERRDRITIEHLLAMRSGMAWDESSASYTSPANDIYHINNGDGVEHSLNLDMVAEPGEVWQYNTGASHLLAAIVQVATGMTTLNFAQQYLFEPIGIDRAYWFRDRAGWYKGGFDLSMSARNMARFGFLFLNNGTWDGEQIISENWATASTETITQHSDYEGYGFQWWTSPELGMYYAAGLYGQYIFVIPEQDIVVTFTSDVRSGAYPHINMVDQYVYSSGTNNVDQPGSQGVLSLIIGVTLIAPVILAGGYWLFLTKFRKP